MIIRLRCLVKEDVRKVLKKDAVVAKECDLDADHTEFFTVFETDFGGEAASRIFELSSNTSGLKLTPAVLLDEQELEEVKFFKLYGKKVVYETERESTINRYFYDRVSGEEHLPPFETKILKGAVLSKIRLKPNMVAYLGDWREEFVVSKHAVAAFERSEIVGFDRLPILNLSTMAWHDDFFMLHTRNVMPGVILDISTPKKNLGIGEWSYVNLGLLSYRAEDLDNRPDFNRTAEPWGTNKSPLWIVSCRVRNCFNQANLKGWEFQPVLEVDSPLHKEYLSLWASLVERISGNPANVLT